MRIGFACGDWGTRAVDEEGKPTLGGSGWYRSGLPSDYLKRNGHDTVLGTLIKHSKTGEFGVVTWDSELHFDFEIIVMQRWMNTGLADEMRTARAMHGQRFVNDVDDHYDGISVTNHAWLSSHPKFDPKTGQLTNDRVNENNREEYRHVLAASDLITVSTPFLADRLSKYGVPVAVVRNAIDLDRWLPHEQHDPPTLGWVGAQPWRSGDLEQLRGVIGPFLERHASWSFHHSGHIGQTMATEQLGIDVDAVKCTMLPIERIFEYPKLFEPIDVGVVPLNDVPFNHAKSAIKGMEYAASGVPFVASAAPEYTWLREAHGIGMTARSPRDWHARLSQLEDFTERKRVAREQRKALAALDFARRWIDWLDAYASLL